MEKNCKIHGLTEFRQRKNGKYRCLKCNIEAVNNARRKIKLLAIQYKGGQCIKCGYSKCVASLEFHHRNPEEKDFNIGSNGNYRAWERVKKELDKCDLVCSNCHKEIHSSLDS